LASFNKIPYRASSEESHALRVIVQAGSGREYISHRKEEAMTEALATRGPLSTNIEQVLIGGDLAQLNPEERLNYYNHLCSNLGLNALTQPFAYIVLNGKLQLYAKKDCTEQLRKIHGVSITKVDPKQIGDLVVVVADAGDRDGRVDSSTGAVAVKGVEGKDQKGNKYKYDLTGEALANAMMKCETKAKRRVTLSICGLGMLDETEVDTLRQQGVASDPQGNNWQAPNPPISNAPSSASIDVNPNDHPTPSAISHDQGEPDIRPRSQKQAQTIDRTAEASPFAPQGQQSAPQGQVMGGEPAITEKQRKMLFAISRSANLSDQDVKDTLAGIGLTCHRDDIPKGRFQDVLDAVDPQFKFHTRKD
jgi:hypothetical protein